MARHAMQSDRPITRRALGVVLAVGALGALGGGVASADPDFGPGNTSGVDPQAPNAHCHPPGQTVDFPACK